MKSLEDRVAGYISEYASQGDHLTGSSVDIDSAGWMASIISGLGARPLINEYVFSRLVVDRAALQLGDTELSGVPLFDGGQTTQEGLRGSLGLLGSDADIGVVMLSSEANDKSLEQLGKARRDDTHRGIIAVTDARMPGDGVATLNAEDFISPYGCPVLQVANAHWRQLSEAAAGNSQVRLVVNSRRLESKLINVGARVPGADPAADPIVVMTPRSGWWRCASERGGGIAAYFEIMKAAVSGQFPRDMIFTANSGHELGHLGLDLFLEANRQLVRKARCWIHLGANFAAKGADAGVLLQYSDEEFRSITRQVMNSLQLKADREMPLEKRPWGEARNIFDGGGRYISILGSNPLFHHPADTWPDAVDSTKVCNWVRLMVQLVAQLNNRAR